MKKAMGDDGPSMNFGGGGFGGGGLGKSGARVIASKDVGVTFKDVAGQEEAKESLKEVVDFWRSRSATRRSAPSCRVVLSLLALRVPVRPACQGCCRRGRCSVL